jgi:DNA-directed RNA polymerase sigma subunit (sigma70/sigma32)
MSLEDVAAELGVSRERVFKIERSGLKKIRAVLDAAERSAAWRDMIAS